MTSAEETGLDARLTARRVRTASPREREVVLAFPRRLLGPGVLAVGLGVVAVFGAGFAFGRRGATPGEEVERAAVALAEPTPIATPKPEERPTPAEAAQPTQVAQPAQEATAVKAEPSGPGQAKPGDPSPLASGSLRAPLAGPSDSLTGSERTAVKAEATEPKRPAVPGPELVLGPQPALKGWGLQVGAYPSLEEAQAYVDRHAAELAGRRVYVIPTEIEGRGTWHRVRLGSYSSRTSAEADRKKLKGDLAKDAIVVSYK